MSSISLRGFGSVNGVTQGREERGIPLRPLRLVAEVWRGHRAGVLVVPGGQNRPTRRLAFVDGALADRMAYMYLNAAMHCEDLVFEPGPSAGRSDRGAVARLIMDRARTLARNDEGLALTGDYSVALDPNAIAVLPLAISSKSWLLVRANAPLRAASLEGALRDDEIALDIRALLLLGFIHPAQDPAVDRATGPGGLTEAGRSLSGAGGSPEREVTLADVAQVLVETLEDQGALLHGFFVDERLVEQMADGADEIQDLLRRAREEMGALRWQRALDLCLLAHQLRVDHAGTLVHLAIAGLYAGQEPWPIAAERARRYAELAVALDPTDSLVRRLARQVDALVRSATPDLSDLGWLEESSVLALVLA